jgi:hypothetical protein
MKIDVFRDYMLRHPLVDRAPSRSIATPGPYRSFPGYADDAESTDLRGYGAVIWLVQAGLGEADEPLLHRLVSGVRTAQHDAPWPCPMARQRFDGSPGLQTGEKPVFMEHSGHGNARARTEELLELSGAAPAPATALPLVITELVCEPVAHELRRARRPAGALVMVVGRRGEFRFAPALRDEIKAHGPRLVIVEIDPGPADAAAPQLLATFDEAETYIARPPDDRRTEHRSPTIHHDPHTNGRTTTMMTCIDYSDWMKKRLPARDFEPRGKLKDTKAPVFGGPAGTIVPVPPFKPKFRAKAEADDIQRQFEDYLRRQLDDLRRLRAEGRLRLVVVYVAGGALELPEWYLAEAREMGVEIICLDPRELPFAFDEMFGEGGRWEHR